MRRATFPTLLASKIVFLTLESDVEVVQEAVSLGACGYIIKQQLKADLLAGLAAILQGERFISNGMLSKA